MLELRLLRLRLLQLRLQQLDLALELTQPPLARLVRARGLRLQPLELVEQLCVLVREPREVAWRDGDPSRVPGRRRGEREVREVGGGGERAVGVGGGEDPVGCGGDR